MALWPVGAALGPIDGLTLRSVLPESLESALRPDTVKRKWKRQCEMQARTDACDEPQCGPGGAQRKCAAPTCRVPVLLSGALWLGEAGVCAYPDAVGVARQQGALRRT